jgi:hypothetical protein
MSKRKKKKKPSVKKEVNKITKPFSEPGERFAMLSYDKKTATFKIYDSLNNHHYIGEAPFIIDKMIEALNELDFELWTHYNIYGYPE